MACVKKMLKKVCSCTDSIGDSFTAMLYKKYPDIDDVFDVLNEMRAVYDKDDDVDGAGVKDDDKWRPMMLTLGLLYKLQRIQDHHEESWYNQQHIFVEDDAEEERLVHTFGFYWHSCIKVTTALRNVKDDDMAADEELRKQLAEEAGPGEEVDTLDPMEIKLMAQFGLEEEHILCAHITDSLVVDDHCPDFAVLLLHDIKQVLIVICGTRMIPAPKIRDIFMDLYADATPFVSGKAHNGMVIGTNNIKAKIGSKVVDALEANPGYSVMVIGYSLGAGICQLLTLEMLYGESAKDIPVGTDIRCISFGSPPVYKADDPDFSCPNIFSVIYNNDGLASASVSTVTKLFMQIRAVDRLQLRRRDMLKMLWRPIPLQGGDDDAAKDVDDEEDDDKDDFRAKASGSGAHRRTTRILDDDGEKGGRDWKRVQKAVDSVQETGIVHLEHPCKQLYLFKRKEKEIITRRLENTNPLSDHLRLRGSMFNHHMPWGYNALFDEYGTDISTVDLQVLDMSKVDKPGPVATAATEAVISAAATLYPNLKFIDT